MALPSPSTRQQKFVLELNFKYKITKDNKLKMHRLDNLLNYILHIFSICIDTIKLKLSSEVAEQINMPDNVKNNVKKDDDGTETYELNAESREAIVKLNSGDFNNCEENSDDDFMKLLEEQIHKDNMNTIPTQNDNDDIQLSQITADHDNNNTTINDDHHHINNVNDHQIIDNNKNQNNTTIDANNVVNDVSAVIVDNELLTINKNETLTSSEDIIMTDTIIDNNNSSSNSPENNTIIANQTNTKVQKGTKRKIKGSRKKKKTSRKNSPKKPRHSFDDDGAFSDSDHEEEFYYTEIEDDEDKAPNPPSPPTLSHRDMARPPHEDPEYQRQIVGNFRQGLLALSQSNTSKSVPHSMNNAGPINIPTSPLAHHNYTWSSPMSPVKHARWSPRPSTSSAPYPSPTYIHHHYNNNNTNSNSVNHQHHLHQQPQQIQQQGGLTIQNAANMTNLSHSAPSSTTNLTAAIVNATTATVVSPNIQHPHQQQQQTPPHTHGAQHLPTPQPQLQSQPQPQPQPQHHIQPTVQQAPITTTAAVTAAATTNHRSPQSPNRRTRGDNKKCRKVYGMDHKDQWCTQCKWKKACSRFGD